MALISRSGKREREKRREERREFRVSVVVTRVNPPDSVSPQLMTGLLSFGTNGVSALKKTQAAVFNCRGKQKWQMDCPMMNLYPYFSYRSRPIIG